VNKSTSLQEFLKGVGPINELTLVGPFAAARKEWPTPCVFVDGGNRHQSEHPLHYSVGDGDSAWAPVDHLLPEEKDLSDLAFVLSHVPDQVKRLSLVGFLGGRRDHEFINLGEIHRYLKTRKQPTECNVDYSVCAYSAGHWRLDLKGIFSLLALEPTDVRMLGNCRYQIPVTQPLTPLSSHGLSNEGWGLVELIINNPIFVFKNPFT
jgi:thiamine pyrophosphokinase